MLRPVDLRRHPLTSEPDGRAVDLEHAARRPATLEAAFDRPREQHRYTDGDRHAKQVDRPRRPLRKQEREDDVREDAAADKGQDDSKPQQPVFGIDGPAANTGADGGGRECGRSRS
ncbi:MAG: hypothetical protein HND48_18855 [Chloroflexi bacterium]|nr:hypothetical protein [Chloroflexota bacterium]